MSLASEYNRQFAWRNWDKVLDNCPIRPGQLVLDLGCGPGDLARKLYERGAVVTGVDSDLELLTVARAKCPFATFLEQDLSRLAFEEGTQFDGLWCSFTAAYFTDFENIFKSWIKFLKPEAWVCLVDIDDLLGHEPVSSSTRQRVVDFYTEAFRAGRYDFLAGGKLEGVLKNSGFQVHSHSMEDLELAFEGPASPDVAQAWSDRFDRMGGLKNFFGKEFTAFREEYLKCIGSSRHHSTCRVIYSVGTR